MLHRSFLTLCAALALSACSTIPDCPPGQGPVDPAGNNLAPAGYPKWERSPQNALDKLNTTGQNYPGAWSAPDPVTGMVVPSTR